MAQFIGGVLTGSVAIFVFMVVVALTIYLKEK